MSCETCGTPFLGCNDSFSTVCGCYECLCEFCGKTAALSAMLRTPTSMSVMFFADLRAPDLRFGAMRMNTLVWHDMNRCLFTRWAWKHQRGRLKCASMQTNKSAGTYLDALEASTTEDRLAALASRDESEIKLANNLRRCACGRVQGRVGPGGRLAMIEDKNMPVPSDLRGSRIHDCARNPRDNCCV